MCSNYQNTFFKSHSFDIFVQLSIGGVEKNGFLRRERGLAYKGLMYVSTSRLSRERKSIQIKFKLNYVIRLLLIDKL